MEAVVEDGSSSDEESGESSESQEESTEVSRNLLISNKVAPGMYYDMYSKVDQFKIRIQYG